MKRTVSLQWVILFCVTVLVVYLVAVPLGLLIFVSFKAVGLGEGPFTIINYVNIFLDSETYMLLLNTSLFAVVALGTGIPLGVFFSWLVERTNAPLRNIAFALIPLTVAIPSMLYGISWLLLLSPNIGIINVGLMKLLGLEKPLVNPYSSSGQSCFRRSAGGVSPSAKLAGLMRLTT